MDDRRIDDGAAVVDDDVALDRDLAGGGVDLDHRRVEGVAEGAGARRIVEEDGRLQTGANVRNQLGAEVGDSGALANGHRAGWDTPHPKARRRRARGPPERIRAGSAAMRSNLPRMVRAAPITAPPPMTALRLAKVPMP